MLNKLKQWEYALSNGFTVRGFYTEPTGRPVIHFVHGNGYCGLVYEQMLEPLAKHYDIFISDIQGHGDSDVGGHFRGWNRNAEFCAEVWQDFQKQFWPDVPAIAMGHSFGGVMSTAHKICKASFLAPCGVISPFSLCPPSIWKVPIDNG